MNVCMHAKDKQQKIIIELNKNANSRIDDNETTKLKTCAKKHFSTWHVFNHESTKSVKINENNNKRITGENQSQKGECVTGKAQGCDKVERRQAIL